MSLVVTRNDIKPQLGSISSLGAKKRDIAKLSLNSEPSFRPEKKAETELLVRLFACLSVCPLLLFLLLWLLYLSSVYFDGAPKPRMSLWATRKNEINIDTRVLSVSLFKS